MEVLAEHYFEDLLNVMLRTRSKQLEKPIDTVSHLVRGPRPSKERPYVVLIESVRGDVVPRNVLKVVVTSSRTTTGGQWGAILADERDSVVKDLSQGTNWENGLRTVIEPHVRIRNDSSNIYVAAVDSSGLLDSESSLQELGIQYFVRPYLAWPRLTDSQFNEATERSIWNKWCARKGIVCGTSESEFAGFREAALVNPSPISAELSDAFVTSYDWYVKSRGRSPNASPFERVIAWLETRWKSS